MSSNVSRNWTRFGLTRLERARRLISEHGADARQIADGRAVAARENGDLRRMQEWRKLGVLIDTLLVPG